MTLEDYKNIEYGKLNWLSKALNNYPDIITTKELANKFEKGQFGDSHFIKPSLILKLVSLFFLFILVFVLKLVLFTILLTDFPLIIGLIFLLFIILLIVFLGYYSFFDKECFFRFVIDYYGVCVNNQYHTWDDIYETLILESRDGGALNVYLILLKKDDSIVKLNFYKFNVFSKELATIVEYFKNGESENK